MPARLTVALLALVASGLAAQRPAPERVRPNDNRVAAGTLRDGVLSIAIEARTAMWYPDGDDAPGAAIPVFAGAPGGASVPGPLLRARAGTIAEVALHNALARDTLLVHGLHDRPWRDAARPAAITLLPGERRRVRLRLDAPGTYLYWGTTTRRAANFRTGEDGQLTGAIVVDPATGPIPTDRVLVIGMWSDTVHRANTVRQRILGVLNGRSWPHTERLHHTVGDTVRWRVINASADLHPMHLHGFYFRVDARGDGTVDTLLTGARRRLAVTENLLPAASMQVTWVPERAGNWLFHCHVPEHFGPRGSLGARRPSAEPTVTLAGRAHDDHARGGMNGLVMGIEVRPRPGAPRAAPPRDEARPIRLLVRENVGSTAAVPLYGYALHERGPEPPRDSGYSRAPTLELVRGQRV
ncbi:MAG TPA: multicopper oxidase domain-containing protein, partial [Gemmatimonadaceae bacterium]|nr:multicopper oxidase domain-containing protein [Gemmatimonadaceae bacterium]